MRTFGVPFGLSAALFARTSGCAVFISALSVAACTKSQAPSPATKSAAVAPLPAPQPEITKKPRLGEVGVYVDGKVVGVMRITELPPALQPRQVDIGAGQKAPRYTIADYAKALGVDLAKVRALHVQGGERVAVVGGDEVRRVADQWAFSFTQGVRGKPRMHWPAMNVNTTIDMVSALTFFVDKEPPVINGQREYVYPDGTQVVGVPYAAAEATKGTRVYVDGTLVGTLKRKDAQDRLVGAYLDGLGVTSSPRAVDLVDADNVFHRFTPAEWAATRSDLAFTPAPKGRAGGPGASPGAGLAAVRLEGKTARVSALEVFVKATPPARKISPIEDINGNEPDDQGAPGQNEEATD
jgi:hypothetical protein